MPDQNDCRYVRSRGAKQKPANALAYPQSIYRNPSEPDGRRMRAAMAALPFESPKLGTIALGSMTGQNFAAMLDKAILRSQGNGRNVPQIELSAEPEGGDGR
jgi:hypothetical protein